MKEVGTLDATQLINRQNAVLLDVREAKEYAAGHLPNAVHIPLSELGGRGGELAKPRRGPVIAYCERGQRSRPRERRSRSSGSRTSTSSPAASARGRMPACRWRK